MKEGVAPVPEPKPPFLDPEDPRTKLRDRVRDALLALSGYFDSTTNICGLAATDLFSLNTFLGATIEVQVVQTLNRMRDVWDPDDEWALHRFDRQAQTFPDVLFRRRNSSGEYETALGVELKGWYMLAKEREPSFRYRVTPGACADWDLLVVVPWHLSNVLSGVPRVSAPACWPAKHIAEYRNHWWSNIRETEQDASIEFPMEATPYMGRDNTSDKPAEDGGGNFGRIARTGIMNVWVQEILDVPLAGIPVDDWIDFLKQHEAK